MMGGGAKNNFGGHLPPPPPLLVPSCCDKSGTSCYQFFTKLMTVADLLQVVPTRLIQAVRNRSCYELVMSSTC